MSLFFWHWNLSYVFDIWVERNFKAGINFTCFSFDSDSEAKKVMNICLHINGLMEALSYFKCVLYVKFYLNVRDCNQLGFHCFRRATDCNMTWNERNTVVTLNWIEMKRRKKYDMCFHWLHTFLWGKPLALKKHFICDTNVFSHYFHLTAGSM